ncbi:MAG: zinc ribbon domain-containing protein, partial [Candidatus Riflebacteria bacterium]|nr:zinc ribbon domain-containing protein [Candidatus Riflebacteria bacterium]
VPPGSAFCPQCGTPAQAAPSPGSCPACGTQAPAGTAFCPHCGARFPAGPGPAATLPPSPPPPHHGAQGAWPPPAAPFPPPPGEPPSPPEPGTAPGADADHAWIAPQPLPEAPRPRTHLGGLAFLYLLISGVELGFLASSVAGPSAAQLLDQVLLNQALLAFLTAAAVMVLASFIAGNGSGCFRIVAGLAAVLTLVLDFPRLSSLLPMVLSTPDLLFQQPADLCHLLALFFVLLIGWQSAR